MLRELREDVRSLWLDMNPLERVVLSILLPIYAIAWALQYVIDGE